MALSRKDEFSRKAISSEHVASIQKQKPTPYARIFHYQYKIHPFIKLMLFFGLNLLAFMDIFQQIRIEILVGEIILAIAVKIDFYKLKGFIKFLLINFVAIYILFYFVDFNWLSALKLFYDYIITLLVMFLGTFIFIKTTPPRELLVAFRTIHVPKSFALALTIAMSFLPIITENIRLTIMAQKSRGYKVHFWHLGPVLIPSLLNIIDLSVNLAISMESRGYELH